MSKQIVREALGSVGSGDRSAEDNENASEQQVGESGQVDDIDHQAQTPPMKDCDCCKSLKRKIHSLQKTISRLRKMIVQAKRADAVSCEVLLLCCVLLSCDAKENACE